MLQWLRKRAEAGRRAEELYGSVVAAARQPAFYASLGVPDTPEGRLELVILHLYLAVQSLNVTDPASADLKQRIIEVFIADMDDCMREMGIGDLSVPKNVKRAAQALYERATIYQRELMVGEEDGLAARLHRRIFADAAERDEAARVLAHYVNAASTALATMPFEDWVETGAAERQLDASLSAIRIPTT